MDFGEALNAARDGKRVRRAWWPETLMVDWWMECADLHADGSSDTEAALVLGG